MDSAQWNRISDLFERAAERDPAARSRLLESEPDAIRREVERLLREHERGGLLDRPLVAQDAARQDRWTGTTLGGRYRIERFLARGGAGEVYLARDTQIADRAVVVKFLDSYARQDPWLQKNFHKEMEALARIDHHGVVGILDAGETADGLPFLVIEYINGVTLRSEIQKGPLEAGRVARLIRQIGGAVAAAHEKGVLHRDLKPENIMLEHPATADETVRLIDFGIARVERPDEETLTQTTRLAGTTPYMAPEQLAGRPQASSDIFAMGVIAYEMLSGRRPFLAASAVELYQQQRGGVKGELPWVRPEIPTMAIRAVLKQLSFRPADRGASALEAAEQIAAALEGTLREGWSRRRVAAVLAGGAGLAAAGVYEWSTRHPPDASERFLEVVMGTEILEQGFHRNLDIDYHIQFNSEGTSFDSMRVVTNDQGYYWHPLSGSQARAALREPWKLIIEAAVEEGNLWALIDNPRAPGRYSPVLVRNPDGTDSVQCLLRAAPVRHMIDRVLPGPAGQRHRLVLMWKPATQAELWVDGAKLITGYSGEPFYRYAHGLEFGAARNRSKRAAGVFWKVRWELG